jgi:hypothetical protein
VARPLRGLPHTSRTNQRMHPTHWRDARVMPSVDMNCIANDCAKRTCKIRLLVQALRKSSDFLICTQGKSESLGSVPCSVGRRRTSLGNVMPEEVTRMPYADHQGVRIHYQIEGDEPPLVLQHGLS